MNTEDDDLEFLLQKWRDVPSYDLRMKQHVWARIASEDSRSNKSPNQVLSCGMKALSRPALAAVFIGASIVCGILLAEFKLSKARQLQTKELARNYMELIESQEPDFEGRELQ